VKPALLITGATGNQRGAAVRAVLNSGGDRWDSRAPERVGFTADVPAPRQMGATLNTLGDWVPQKSLRAGFVARS
jgi:uncharacterized protein YbjT (DUF2867 family)